MERRDRGINDESKEDKNGGQGDSARLHSPWKGLENNRTCCVEMEEDSSQQKKAAEKVDQNVSKACSVSSPRLSIPDEKECRPCHHLPKKEKGEEVSCENDPQCASNVKIGSYMLALLLDMKSVENHAERSNDKDIGEDHAQPVNPAKDQIMS